MSKCYYCNGSSRGCPECNYNNRSGGKTEALKPVWVPVVGERHPIKANPPLIHENIQEAIAWTHRVQASLAVVPGGAGITLEMVRNMSPSRRDEDILYARWTVEHPDPVQRNRCQCWSGRSIHSNGWLRPIACAEAIAKYVQRKRDRVVEQIKALQNPIPGCTKIRTWDDGLKQQMVEGEWEDPRAVTTFVEPEHVPPAPTLQDLAKTMDNFNVEFRVDAVPAKTWSVQALQREALSQSLHDVAKKFAGCWDKRLLNLMTGVFLDNEG